MSEEQESIYMRGYAAAQLSMLNVCMRGLGVDDPVARAAAYLEERMAVIQYLRSECAEYGDNDWPDDLYISDIIEKHLLQPLLSGMPEGSA